MVCLALRVGSGWRGMRFPGDCTALYAVSRPWGPISLESEDAHFPLPDGS